MRVRRIKRRRAILTGVAAIVVGIFCFLSPTERVENSLGSAQLVSIQQLPDLSELCLPESGSSDLNLNAGLHESGLFAALQQRSVYAASQANGQTTEVTHHPPLRYIRDLDPIYSHIAVDVRRNEVLMQDTNAFSIRVFNRLAPAFTSIRPTGTSIRSRTMSETALWCSVRMTKATSRPSASWM
jgi:hypothetical protein